MALKPAPGKKRGHTPENDSNNKNCKICAPAHAYADLCPNGAVSCRKIFIRSVTAHIQMSTDSSAQWQTERSLQRFAQTQSLSANEITDATTVLPPQYCWRAQFTF